MRALSALRSFGYYAMGWRRFSRGRYREALDCFERMRALDANAGRSEQVHYFEGLCHQAVGDDLRAMNSLRRAYELLKEKAWPGKGELPYDTDVAVLLDELYELLLKYGDAAQAKAVRTDREMLPGIEE